MKKKTERPCKYCGCELKGSGRKVACENPVCIAKYKAEKRATGLKRGKEARRKEKIEILKAKPKFCIHCGSVFTVEDSLRFPVCGNCFDWWEDNKARLRKEREWKSKKKRLKEKKAKKNELTAQKKRDLSRISFEDEEWSQEHYEAMQLKLKKPNGHRCRWWDNIGSGEGARNCRPGSPAELVGNDRFYCKDHQEKLNQAGFRDDIPYVYDGEAYSGYDVW